MYALNSHFETGYAFKGALTSTLMNGVVIFIRHDRIDFHQFCLQLNWTLQHTWGINGFRCNWSQSSSSEFVCLILVAALGLTNWHWIGGCEP